MEWEHADRRPGQSLKAFFAEQFDQQDGGKKIELLALAGPMRAVCYGAYRFTNQSTGEERISALVVPVKIQRGQARIDFAVLTEYDGPLEYHRCPKKIYAMLTRFRHCEESPHAREWRHRVENWHKRIESVPALKPGLKLVFKDPVRFDNGDVQSEFTIETSGPVVLRGENKQMYKIAKLRDRIARGDATVSQS